MLPQHTGAPSVKAAPAKHHPKKKAAKKKKAKLASRIPDVRPIPPCHLCTKGFKEPRSLKRHYIQVHYAKKFVAKYTQGKMLSLSEDGWCELCPYRGKTRDVAYHVGIAHGKLQDYLPGTVWSSLFGFQSRSFKPMYDQEGRLTGPQPACSRSSKKKSKEKKMGSSSFSRMTGLSEASTGKRVPERNRSAVLPPPPLPPPPTGNPLFHCHLCEHSAGKFDLRRHYLCHFREEVYARYSKAASDGSIKAAGFQRPGLLQCELCPFQGRLGSLVLHAWTGHSVVKEYLPDSVWRKIRPVVPTACRVTATGGKQSIAARSAKKRLRTAAVAAGGATAQPSGHGHYQTVTVEDGPSFNRIAANVEVDASSSTVRSPTMCQDQQQQMKVEESPQNGGQQLPCKLDDTSSIGSGEMLVKANNPEGLDCPRCPDEIYEVETTVHNSKMWECIYCASETRCFDSCNQLRHHLILGHFVDDLCQDYGIDRNNNNDDDAPASFSCSLCQQCEGVPLAGYLLHLGIGHRKLDDYLPLELRQRLAG